jgi:transcriptional regulator with XRE-family HTH domain
MKKTGQTRKKYTFANWFRKIRKEKELTQEGAAKELHVKPSTISRWESGAEPRAAHLQRICMWSGVDAVKLLRLVSKLA